MFLMKKLFLKPIKFYPYCLQGQNNFVNKEELLLETPWLKIFESKKNFCLKFIYYRKLSHYVAQINNLEQVKPPLTKYREAKKYFNSQLNFH